MDTAQRQSRVSSEAPVPRAGLDAAVVN